MGHIHKIIPQRGKAKDPSGTLVNSEKVKTKVQMKEHPPDKEIKCNICGGAFDSQQHMLHMKIHANYLEKVFLVTSVLKNSLTMVPWQNIRCIVKNRVLP